MTHAFFKALLFLGAGAVMHALHGELRVSHLGGLREKMPITAMTFFVGALAISGVPGLSGFFSKDMILEAAYVHGHTVAWLVGVIAAGFTPFYVFRAYFRTFTGESRVDPERGAHVHEMPGVMTVPMILLAVLAVIGGWVGLPGHFLWGDQFGAYLAPTLAKLPGAEHGHASAGLLVFLMVVATSVGLFGIYLAWLLYVRSPDLPDRIYARTRGIYNILWNRYWVDEIYDTLVIQPYQMASRFFWKGVDVVLVDGLVNGVGEVVTWNSGVWRRLQSGSVQQYALGMLLGAVVLVGGYWLVGR
jgi:NADH-quinone oxidoreductase subunit L